MSKSHVWALKRIGFDEKYIPLKEGLNRLGRSEDSIVCQSFWVSRRQCEIKILDAIALIKDCNSFNGTYIGNSRLEGERFTELNHGDIISIGKPFVTDGVESINKDHYVFEIKKYKTSSRKDKIPLKRRSLSPGHHEPVKRICPSLPKQGEKIEFVDLTVDDPPLIKKEPEGINDVNVIEKRLLGQPPVTSPRQADINAHSYESLISEMMPLASSTLINVEKHEEIKKKVENGQDFTGKILEVLLEDDKRKQLKEAFLHLLEGLSNGDNCNNKNLNNEDQQISESGQHFAVSRGQEPNSNCADHVLRVERKNIENQKGNESPDTHSSSCGENKTEIRIIENKCHEEDQNLDLDSESNHVMLQRKKSMEFLKNILHPIKEGNLNSVMVDNKENSLNPVKSNFTYELSDDNDSSSKNKEAHVPLIDANPLSLCENEKEDLSEIITSSVCIPKTEGKLAHGGSVVSPSHVISSKNYIYKEGKGLIIKGAKKKTDKVLPSPPIPKNESVPKEYFDVLSKSMKDNTNESRKPSLDSSGEGFIGFNFSDDEGKGRFAVLSNHVSGCDISSSQGEIIFPSVDSLRSQSEQNDLLVHQSSNVPNEPTVQESISQGLVQPNEKAPMNQSVFNNDNCKLSESSLICKDIVSPPDQSSSNSLIVALHEKKDVSPTPSERIRRSCTADVQDVAQLLRDLEKSSDDSSLQTPLSKPLHQTSGLTLPITTVHEASEIRLLKNLPKPNPLKFNEKSTNGTEVFNKIEQELRDVLGESLEEHNSQVTDVKEISFKIETIVQDCDDHNNSFSQGGTDSVIEVDEDDEEYSQLFSKDQENNFVESGAEGNTLPLCSSIIKEDVDDVHEETGLDFFESHFSQCSQDEGKALSDVGLVCQEKPFFLVAPKVSETESLVSIVNSYKNDSENEKKTPRCESVKSSLCTPCSSEAVEPVDSEPIPKIEGLSGAQLVKSTLLSKPLDNKMVKKKKDRKLKEEPSATKQALLKRKQLQIKLERSEKLKNLALQNKAPDAGCNMSSDAVKIISNKENEANLQTGSKQQESRNETGENSGNTWKAAKITERNRSTILLEGLIETKTVEKRRGRTKKSRVTQPSETKEIQQKEGPKEKQKKGCLKHPDSISSCKRVTFNEMPMVRSYECDGTLEKQVNKVVSNDKVPLYTNVVRPRETSCDEFIINILHWNHSWRNESKIVKGDPPVYKEVFNTKDMFVSYGDYKRWLYPLLLYELWANMMKHMDEMEALKSSRTFKGIILMKEPRYSSKGKLLTLKCCIPLQGKDIPSLIDPMDILLLYVNTSAKTCLVMYGIVMSQVKVCSARDTSDPHARTYLTKLNFKPDVCAYFDVVIYNSLNKPVATGYCFKTQPIYNMVNEMRQYEGLVKVESSPLLWTVIDPAKNCSVFLSKDFNDKIVSKYPLNEEQTRAILCTSQTVFSNKPSISLIHGPPGTGKTRVIVALVEQLLYRFKSKNGRRQRILLCAHTNTAIDEICLRLLEVRRQLPRENRFKLSRYGRKDKINPKLYDILTTSIARNEVERMNIEEVFTLELSLLKAKESMVAQALESSESIERCNYLRKYDSIQAQIKNIQPLVNKTASKESLKKETDRLVSDEELRVIFHSDIIATTLGSCTARRMLKAFNNDMNLKEDKGEIGVCIIDEATQSTDATTLLPLLHGVKNFILVGDPQQLPPVVNSETAKKNGLSRSLFSRFNSIWSEVDPNSLPHQSSVPLYKLKTQYRMHPEIAKFPSMNFYNNELITPDFLSVDRGFKPYAVFTHRHLSDVENIETNKKEAELVINVVDEILKQQVYNCLSIGLIVPYQKQRAIVSDLVRDKKWLRLVTVSTIDSYQGQEKDIVILTCVRTNGIGFLSDYQRCNVALTRAKRAFYIIGNFSSLQADPVWKSLLNNAQSRGIHLDIKSTTSANEVMDFILVNKKRKRSR